MKKINIQIQPLPCLTEVSPDMLAEYAKEAKDFLQAYAERIEVLGAEKNKSTVTGEIISILSVLQTVADRAYGKESLQICAKELVTLHPESIKNSFALVLGLMDLAMNADPKQQDWPEGSKWKNKEEIRKNFDGLFVSAKQFYPALVTAFEDHIKTKGNLNNPTSHLGNIGFKTTLGRIGNSWHIRIGLEYGSGSVKWPADAYRALITTDCKSRQPGG